MTAKELSKVFLINEAIIASINQLKCLMSRELLFLLGQDTQLLSLDLVLQVHCPGLKE